MKAVDIDPRLGRNRAMIALMERLGYDARPVTPELEDARRRVIAVLKMIGTPANDDAGGIDWSRPIEDVTGKPRVYSGPILPGQAGYADGGRHLIDDTYWYGDDGFHCNDDGNPKGLYPSWPQLRNIAAIDWDKPLELLDGTPVRLHDEGDGVWKQPTRRGKPAWAWIMREDGARMDFPGYDNIGCFSDRWPIIRRDGSLWRDHEFGPIGPVVRNRQESKRIKQSATSGVAVTTGGPPIDWAQTVVKQAAVKKATERTLTAEEVHRITELMQARKEKSRAQQIQEYIDKLAAAQWKV